MSLQVVKFPEMPDGDMTKIEKMLETMGEFMEVKFTIVPMRSISVEFDTDRTDVAHILTRIASAKREQLGLTKKKAKASA